MGLESRPGRRSGVVATRVGVQFEIPGTRNRVVGPNWSLSKAQILSQTRLVFPILQGHPQSPNRLGLIANGFGSIDFLAEASRTTALRHGLADGSPGLGDRFIPDRSTKKRSETPLPIPATFDRDALSTFYYKYHGCSV